MQPNEFERCVRSIFIIDQDPALDRKYSLVCAIKNVICEGSIEDIKMEVLLEHDVGKHIKMHNVLRGSQVNYTILKRTGKLTYLRPIKLRHLEWEFK